MPKKQSVSKRIKIGSTHLSRYERARIIGARALQLSHGAPPLLNFGNTNLEPIKMATMELNARVLPLGINRRFQNGKSANIPIQWLEDNEYTHQVNVDEEMKYIKKLLMDNK